MTYVPDPRPRSELAEVEPHSPGELKAIFKYPLRIMELVLTEQERLSKTIVSGANPMLLAGTLLYTSVLFSLPYGAVLGISRFWHIAVLFVGSLLICFPSLQVFSLYIGCRVNHRQNLALGLVITCVAAIFTFGFFPILWFLRATMLEDSRISPRQISVALLAFSLFAGVAHLFRCLRRVQPLIGTYPLLMACWLGLFTFITQRMARLLDLL